MYLASLLLGLRPLPDLLQEPILALMPGPVFGFLIDNLQHLGKVVRATGDKGQIGCGAPLPPFCRRALRIAVDEDDVFPSLLR